MSKTIFLKDYLKTDEDCYIKDGSSYYRWTFADERIIHVDSCYICLASSRIENMCLSGKHVNASKEEFEAAFLFVLKLINPESIFNQNVQSLPDSDFEKAAYLIELANKSKDDVSKVICKKIDTLLNTDKGLD